MPNPLDPATLAQVPEVRDAFLRGNADNCEWCRSGYPVELTTNRDHDGTVRTYNRTHRIPSPALGHIFHRCASQPTVTPEEMDKVVSAVRDAVLSAERTRLVAMTSEQVVEAAAVAIADAHEFDLHRMSETQPVATFISKNGFRRFAEAALPVLLGPEVAKREAVERERDFAFECVKASEADGIAYGKLITEMAAVEEVVRRPEVCPFENTEEGEAKYVCIGEDGDPIIEADTLAEAVAGVVACWGRLQEQYEERVGKLTEENRGYRENNIETNKMRIAAEAQRDALKGVVTKLIECGMAYRAAHDLQGDGSHEAGYAWDQMRRAEESARAALRGDV